jgi:hypothetical protein
MHAQPRFATDGGHGMTAADRAPFREDWRDPAAYAALCRIDRAGLMWEWLRRNSDYVAWHAKASQAT